MTFQVPEVLGKQLLASRKQRDGILGLDVVSVAGVCCAHMLGALTFSNSEGCIG